jgi:hypothetical protein
LSNNLFINFLKGGFQKMETKKSIKDLKPADTSEEVKETKEKKTPANSLTEEQFGKYCDMLATRKPLRIKTLLDEFELPHTNNGRERFRTANRKINSDEAIPFQVEGVYLTDEGGKCFRIVGSEASAVEA